MAVPPSDDAAERLDRLEQELQRLAQENLALADRLDRAEQQARRRRNLLGYLVLAGAFTIMAGRAVIIGRSRVVQAEWFALQDRNGNIRAVLQLTEDSPMLAFYDRNGKNLVQIHAWHDGSAGMNVLDTAGTVRLSAGRFRDGAIGLATYCPNGKGRINLTARPDGPAGLGVLDPAGRLRTGVGIAKSGRMGLDIYDPDGTTRVENGLRPDGSAGLTVSDPAGKPRTMIGVAKDGAAGVEVYDREGRPAFRAPQVREDRGRERGP
jgi:hypothetical protein